MIGVLPYFQSFPSFIIFVDNAIAITVKSNLQAVEIGANTVWRELIKRDLINIRNFPVVI